MYGGTFNLNRKCKVVFFSVPNGWSVKDKIKEAGVGGEIGRVQRTGYWVTTHPDEK